MKVTEGNGAGRCPQTRLDDFVHLANSRGIPPDFPSEAEFLGWIESRMPRILQAREEPDKKVETFVELWSEIQAILVGAEHQDLPCGLELSAAIEPLENAIKRSESLSSAIIPDPLEISPSIPPQMIATKLLALAREFRASEPKDKDLLRDSGLDSIPSGLRAKLHWATRENFGSLNFEPAELRFLGYLSGENSSSDPNSDVNLPDWLMRSRRIARTDPARSALLDELGFGQ